MIVNHGVFSAQSKRSLAFSFETPTDAEDDSELVPHAAAPSPHTPASGSLGILSPIPGGPHVTTSISASKRKSMNNSSARHRKSQSDSPATQQSPGPFLKSQSPSLSSRDKAVHSARQRLGASFDSSFSGSPTGLPGSAATSASAAAVPGSAAAASLAESSSAPSSLSSSEGQRTCTVCGENWSCESREREYFVAKGLHAPRRCGKCRGLKKLELVSPGSRDANDSGPASGGPKDSGIARETEAEQSAGASNSVRHDTYRGTNLQGIGFIYVGEVSASGRQEGFGSQVPPTARS
jgi:hypothetical protein